MLSIAAHQPNPTHAISSPSPSPPPSKIFRSRLPDIAITTHLPLHEYCFERAADHPDRPCIISSTTGRTFTYAETRRLSLQTAAGLTRLGLRRGDTFMILLPNCPEFVFSFLAASITGTVATPANPFFTPAEISKQLSAAGAKLVITQSSFINKFPPNLTVITIDEGEPPKGCISFAEVIKEDESERRDADDDNGKDSGSEAGRYDNRDGDIVIGNGSDGDALDDGDGGDIYINDIGGDDALALPFSSGTTGLPKGVILTHKSLITGVAQQVDGENPNLYLSPDDVVLCVLPLFHIFSLNSVLLCALRAGASVLVVPKFEILSLLSMIESYRVTVAAVVPPIVLAMAKNTATEGFDLSSIRIVLSGAAPLGTELQKALQERLPQAVFGQGYGMTEAGPVLTMCPAFARVPSPAKDGSCGCVVRNAEMKIVDLETGLSLGKNQPGEICIRGQQIMKGYLNDPEATANTIDAEGWLHTGDVGFVDDDDEIFIVDRVKELIKFKGFQVPPAELEALLLGHPAIADAAVVPAMDEVAGEVPAAFIVRVAGEELTEQTVKDFVSKQVVFYKRLHKVYFIDAIPKSPAGKILRRELRARLAGGYSQ